MRAKTVITAPVVQTGILNVSFSAAEIEFACVKLPIPNEANTVNKANKNPIKFPTLLFLNACFIVYIGPPDISPFSFTTRYLIASIHSANFEVSPKQAEIHIHTNAPGPPNTIAVATPTIFPVPIVAANAVINAENGDISPLPLFCVLASLLKTLFKAYPRFLHVKNFKRIVRNIPVPTNKTSITGPHTKSSILDKIFENSSIIIPPYILFN